MRGTATLARGVEWRYYRCAGRCGAPSANADAIERTVVEAIRSMALPARAIDRARDDLARRLQVPTAGLADKKRQRISNALDAIKKQHMWGDLSDAEYRAQKAELEQSLSELPASDKLVMFDQHRKVVRSLAESLDAAAPGRIKELVALLVERVEVEAGAVDPDRIDWTPPARPFFDGHAAEVVGLKRPRRDSGTRQANTDDPLAWYAV